MLEVLVPVALLTNGLAAGVLVGTQMGGWPLLNSLPPGRYIHAHAFFSTRYDPFMPVCLLLATLGGSVLGFVAESRIARVLYAAAAVLCAATVLISLTKNVPVNTWVRTLDPDNLPADFAARDPRRHWGRWNGVRTAFATTALVLQCAALVPLV